MKKIEKLTQEQVNKFPEYADKWLAIGLCNKPIDREKATKAINLLYKCAGLKKPQIYFSTSPLGCLIFYQIIKYFQVKGQVKNQVKNQIINLVDSKVRDQVNFKVINQVVYQVINQIKNQIFSKTYTQIKNQLLYQIKDQIINQIKNQVVDQVNSQIIDQITSQVRNQVTSQVRNQIIIQVRNHIFYKMHNYIFSKIHFQISTFSYGLHDSVWLSFYDYFKNECNLDLNKINGLISAARECGWYLPYENVCIVGEKPIITFNNENKIHCENDMAIKYSDGWGVWSLNGVKVSEELVMAKEFKPDLLLKEKNAEVRREVVRKFGIGNICRQLKAQTIDKMGNYELLLLDLQDGRKRPYLKMLNPSITEWHVEGVHPKCTKVREALAWRNGIKSFEEPIILT